MDSVETMRVHRRFTLVGEGSLRSDPEGMWTTYRHLKEKVAAERARIRRELLASFNQWPPQETFEEALDRICPEGHPTPPAQEGEEPAGTSSPALRD